MEENTKQLGESLQTIAKECCRENLQQRWRQPMLQGFSLIQMNVQRLHDVVEMWGGRVRD